MGVYPSFMNSDVREKLTKRANRVVGQVGGIQKMVADDRYCVDILNQIAAARAALDALGVELLNSHLQCCILGHGTGSEHEHAKPMKPQQLLEELQTALSRFLR